MQIQIIYTDVKNYAGYDVKDGIVYVVISREFEHDRDMHNKIMLEVVRMFLIKLENC